MSAATIATSVPQFLLHTAALPWVAGSWYYETKDSGSDPTDIQDNFGLYDANYAAKAAQCAFADASAIIAEAKAMAVQSVGNGLTIVRVTTPRGLAVVAWSATARWPTPGWTWLPSVVTRVSLDSANATGHAWMKDSACARWRKDRQFTHSTAMTRPSHG